eukprot:15435679-Alexandrium_andersonii.AAC.1
MSGVGGREDARMSSWSFEGGSRETSAGARTPAEGLWPALEGEGEQPHTQQCTRSWGAGVAA